MTVFFARRGRGLDDTERAGRKQSLYRIAHEAGSRAATVAMRVVFSDFQTRERQIVPDA